MRQCCGSRFDYLTRMDILIILFISVAVITLIGHGIWVFLAWFLRTVSGNRRDEPIPTLSAAAPEPTQQSHSCHNCGERLTINMKFCGVCGAHRPTLAQEEMLRDL